MKIYFYKYYLFIKRFITIIRIYIFLVLKKRTLFDLFLFILFLGFISYFVLGFMYYFFIYYTEPYSYNYLQDIMEYKHSKLNLQNNTNYFNYTLLDFFNCKSNTYIPSFFVKNDPKLINLNPEYVNSNFISHNFYPYKYILYKKIYQLSETRQLINDIENIIHKYNIDQIVEKDVSF
jgi:hypothetical protein